MTTAEIETAVGLMTVQLSEMIQATVDKILGRNKRTIELASGSTPVVFENAYEENVDWDLVYSKVVTADGFEIGFELTDITNLGFTVTVEEACTFKFIAESFYTWIAD